jgi:DNA-binding SARP family transcriptional activator
LGPVEVRSAGLPLGLGGPRQSALLAILLLHAGETVATNRIIDLLWPDAAPKDAGAVQVYVSRLRAVLRSGGADEHGTRLTTETGGYALHLGDAELDLARFRALVAEAATEPRAEQGAELLRQALALWRSEALADLAGPVRMLATSIEEVRLQAVEDLAEIDIRLGRHRVAIQELTAEIRRTPLRESLTALLMRALDRSDRRPEALAAYETVRRRLADDLGIDPGQQLQELHLRLLRAGSSPPAVEAEPERATGPAQLPPMPVRFVGRTAELTALDTAYQRRDGSAGPICAVTGPGGVGKTATVVRWIRQAAARFPDGQLFADLGGQQSGVQSALERFLHALGHPREDIPADLGERAALFRSAMAERRCVVLLDNAASSEQVRPLLAGSPDCLTIVTSRNRLDGLVARDGAESLRLGMMSQAEAQELLTAVIGVERATKADAADLAQLATLCDHLPLALRIAAARIVIDDRLPRDMVTELTDARTRLSALDVEAGDTAVRSAFEVSYAGLPAGSAALFRLLGLVPRTALPHGAAAALAGLSASEETEAVGVLTDLHLIDDIGDERLRMHDLMRLYAAERSAEEDDEAVRRAGLSRLADWYVQHGVAAQAGFDPYRKTVPMRLTHPLAQEPSFDSANSAKAWFDAESDNLLALTRSTIEHGMNRESWQLADCQYSYLLRTHALAVLRETHELGVTAARSDGRLDAERLMANGLGVAFSMARDFDQAIRWMERAAEIGAELGSERDQVVSRLNIASAYGHKGDRAESERHMRQALTGARHLDDPYVLSVCLSNLGWLCTEEDRLHEAVTFLTEALAIAVEHDISQQIPPLQVHLAHLNLKLRDYAQAADHARAAIAVRDLGDHQSTGRAIYWLGMAFEGLGRLDEAIACWQESLTLLNQIGSRDASFSADALDRVGRQG